MKTDITVVLDRSGSMESIAKDVVTGLNEFVHKQQEVEGEAWFTLVQFDDEYDVVHFRAPIADVPKLTRRTYVPRGSTALLDAIGRTIVDISARIASMAPGDRPDQIVFAVATDGQENASHEFTRRQIFKMIREREKSPAGNPRRPPPRPGSSCSLPPTRMRSRRAARWASLPRSRWTSTPTLAASRRR